MSVLAVKFQITKNILRNKGIKNLKMIQTDYKVKYEFSSKVSGLCHPPLRDLPAKAKIFRYNRRFKYNNTLCLCFLYRLALFRLQT
jgi:hypothetical protein